MTQSAFELSVRAFTDKCRETTRDYTQMHETYATLHASVSQKSQCLDVLKAEQWQLHPSQHLDAIGEAISRDVACVQEKRDALHGVQLSVENLRAECRRALTDLLTTFHALNTKLSTGAWLLTYEGPVPDEGMAGIRGVSDSCDCAPWKEGPRDTSSRDEQISERVNDALCNNIPSGVTLFADQKLESDIMMTRQQNWKHVVPGQESIYTAPGSPADDGLVGAPKVPNPVVISAARSTE